MNRLGYSQEELPHRTQDDIRAIVLISLPSVTAQRRIVADSTAD